MAYTPSVNPRDTVYRDYSQNNNWTPGSGYRVNPWDSQYKTPYSSSGASGASYLDLPSVGGTNVGSTYKSSMTNESDYNIKPVNQNISGGTHVVDNTKGDTKGTESKISNAPNTDVTNPQLTTYGEYKGSGVVAPEQITDTASVDSVTGGLQGYVQGNRTGTGEVKYTENPYVKGSNPQVDTVLGQMDANAAAWHTATTPEEKSALVTQNKELASSLSQYGIDAGFNSVTGKWTFLEKIPIIEESSWRNMTFDQILEGVNTESSHITRNREAMWEIADEIGKMGNVDYAAIMLHYDQRLENYLQGVEQRLLDRRNNGMDDPGLQAAIQILREDNADMREQMLENLNARGISRSGLLAEAELKLARGFTSQEQLMVGQYLSMLEQNYQAAMDNITNQRVGFIESSQNLAVNSAFKQEELRQTAARDKANVAANIYSTDAYTEAQNKSTAAKIYGDNQDRAIQEDYNLGNQYLQASTLVETINNNLRNYNLDVATLAHNIATDTERINVSRQSVNNAAQQWQADFDLRKADSAVDKWYKEESLKLEERRSGMDDATYEKEIELLDLKLIGAKLENQKSEWELETAKKTAQELDTQKAQDHIITTQAQLSTYSQMLENEEISLTQLVGMITDGTLYKTLGINADMHDAETENALFGAFVEDIYGKAEAKYKSFDFWNKGVGKYMYDWVRRLVPGITTTFMPSTKERQAASLAENPELVNFVEGGYSRYTP